MKKTWGWLIAAVVGITMLVVPAWGAALSQTLQGGDSLTVACNGSQLNQTRIDATHRRLSCVASTTTSTTTTTTTVPTTTASTTTSSTTTLATTTTTAPTTTVGGSSACGLANAAFCETFDAPRNGGTQTGDLDPVLWGVSRVSGSMNPGQNQLDPFVASHNPCGGSSAVYPAADVRICNGQMVESINDGGGVVNLDTYPKQPFDFAGRTGKVVFDVSADSTGSHGAWPEFAITDEPVPGTHGFISSGDQLAKNEIGFSMSGSSPSSTDVGVDQIFASVNGSTVSVPLEVYQTITKGSRSAMNHIEVDLSTTRIDIYGTDAGGGALKHMAGANLSLGFSKGLVWLNDAHYNARKSIEPCECGTSYDHFFAWDNLGFDGPKTYRDRGFDVPLNNAPGCCLFTGDSYVNLGYNIGQGPVTFTVNGVTWSQTPTAAKVVLNAYSFASTPISVSVNGHAAQTLNFNEPFGITSSSIPIPLSDVVAGTNTLRFTSGDSTTTIFNATLILVAADPVP